MKELVSIVIGLVIPLAISFLKNKRWPKNAKLLLSLVVCIFFGAVQVLADGVVTRTLDLRDLPALAALIFTAATVMYRLYFEHTDLNRTLEQKDVV